ncbi:MAG: D-alanyl-D-alanine carboxypeptidase [Thermosynechococcaceae cyanobacterium]
MIAMVPMMQRKAGQIKVIGLIFLLFTGCAPANTSLPEPSANIEKTQNAEETLPLNLALQPSTPIENPAVTQFLSQLSVSQSAQGVWMQSNTQLLANHQGTTPLPAASLTKIATSLAALKTLGPDHRFITQISANGPINDGVLQGDLVIEGGADPFFVWESAIALGNDLAQKGIQKITGNLIIQGPFYMNFKTDPQQTGALLKQGINANLWPTEAQTQYKTLKNTPKPQIEIQGVVQVGVSGAEPTRQPEIPQSTVSSTVMGLQSLPLDELLKRMNRYSNNAMAEMIAQQVGGPQNVAQIAAQAAGVPQSEIQLINGSGLGVDNRISPRAVCGMMLAIETLLHQKNMTIADILAVTGQDAGILDQRSLPPNAVIKSGTLNAVSALAGALSTEKQDVVWFAIINGEGSPDVFRPQQERLLQTLMAQWGTAKQRSPLLKTSASTVTIKNKSAINP